MRAWVVNSSGTRYQHEGNQAVTASIKQNLGLLSMFYDGTNFTTKIDGTQWKTATATGVLQSLPTTPVRLGQSHNIKFGEFVVFNDTLSSANELKMEGYLAHKWDLEGDLPSGHTYKSSAPSTAEGGWRIERASSGDDAIALNMVGAGGEYSSNVPMNDNQWHHLVTTFGGGNKKIYVDGVQVASASQTGSVTASGLPLIFGDPIAKTDDRPKIDDVRIYSTVLSAADVAALYNNGAGDIGQPKFAITSPATVSGSAGKSISYQISEDAAYGMTGYNSTVSYELLNAPSWMSVGSGSGTVTGTPPAAGTYTFQVKASNTLGTAVKDVTLTATSFENWNYALSFTTDYSGGTPLADWNMLVRFSDDTSTGMGTAGFRYSQANANGGDLRFVDKFGSELKYEIANWNTAGESQVWVRVPRLAQDSNITAYWGNPSAGLPSYSSNGTVWDGYFGVYHLEQTSGSAKDSSPFGNDLSGANSPVRVNAGMSGAAYSATSTANNGFSSNISGQTKATSGTYTIWAKTIANPADDKSWMGVEYNSGNSIRVQTSSANPVTGKLISGLEASMPSKALWFDASDLNADGTTDSTSTGSITSWNDKSGNSRNAGSVVGTPDLNTTHGPNDGRVVQFRSGSSNGTTGDEEFSISGTFTVKDHFYVVRSPSANWSDYGGIIGGGNSRQSNFIVERNQKYFHSNQYPSKVWYNGNSITSGNFALPSLTDYFILRVVVNDGNIGNRTGWKLGDDGTGWSMDMDLAEAICFSSELSDAEGDAVEGYLNSKWGLNSLSDDHPASVYFAVSDPNDNVGSGNWHMLSVTSENGKMNFYVDGVLDGTGNSWFFPGLNTVTGLSLGKGPNSSGPDATFDEATFSSVPRSADWLLASYNNQKQSSTYLNFDSLVGPISLNDPDNTKIFGKKDTTITSYTVAHSGSGSFSASGLPPGLSINAATGVISGSTSVTGSQNVTVTATGATAGGGSVTVTKVYNIQITDPSSFPFRMDLTLSGYTGSSTLTDFPVLVSLSSSITGFSYNGFLDSDGDGVRTGGDLRFFASSGQELAYEIADWNTSGTSSIWVKAPSISGTNTVITAAWGKTGTETTPDYSTDDPVWSNGYEGAWHLDQISSGITNDSSPNGIHFTVNGGATTTGGHAGNAISFDGTDDELETLGYKGISGAAARSMQFWIKTSSVDKSIMSWGRKCGS